MNVEERLVDALAEYDRVEPAPDLFARVRRSLAAERAHRTRVARWSAGTASGLAAVVALVAVLARSDADGVAVVPPAPMAGLEVALLTTLVVLLGPAIRRFGSILVDAVFRTEPATAPVFLRLVDTAYYLVFAGYVLVDVPLPLGPGTESLAVAVDRLLDRVAGLLLLMGVLHTVTILVLPVIGLLHTAAVRRHRRALAGAGAPHASPAADRADRVARVIVLLALGYLAVQLLLAVGIAIGLGIGG